MDGSLPDFPVHHHLLELVQTHVHWVGDVIQPTHPVAPFSSHLQSCPASGSFPMSYFFAWGGQSIEVSASSINPSNEHPGLISFRVDWLDLLTVQGTLKSLLQHHSSKASILQYSAFFIVQLSHPYMTTGKTIILTRWTFVSKVMSLLFNTLSRLVIAFLPGSKHILISRLQSPSAEILEPPQNKVCHCFHYFPIYLPWSVRMDAMILVFWMLSFKPVDQQNIVCKFLFILHIFYTSIKGLEK